MPINQKQRIRGTRILLTVFYGFLLSSILFRYIIHGIVETVRRPSNGYAISMIVIGILVLVAVSLAIYATWFDNAIIMLVAGIVFIFMFILTLVFGIIRIINAKSNQIASPIATTTDIYAQDQDRANSGDAITIISDKYALAEDVTKLIIELVAILFAILGAFILYRYIKSKYAAVPTSEPKPA